MRILLLGKNGQVGWELGRLLPALGAVESFDYPVVDFSRPEDLRAFVRRGAWDVIVNAAAYTAVDQAEGEPDRAMAVNGTAPGVLAEEAARMGAAIVHYSTDYVFDGTKSAPYREEDPTGPLNVYGRTKLEGDRRIEAAGGSHLILRTSWIYGMRGRNFLLTIRRLAREQAKLRIVDDQVGCPTWCRPLAEASIDLLRAVDRSEGESFSAKLASRRGVYHYSSEGEVSWFGFARAILELDPGGAKHWVHMASPVKTEEYPTPARRPRYSVLSKEKIRKAFGVSIKTWRDQLVDCLQSESTS